MSCIYCLSCNCVVVNCTVLKCFVLYCIKVLAVKSDEKSVGVGLDMFYNLSYKTINF